MRVIFKSWGWDQLACAGALLPFLLSLIVHTAVPSLPLSIAAGKPRPALVFHQYQVDLGRIQPTSEVRGTFIFENRGPNNVQIIQVTPSCGCLQPQLSQKHLKPGEQGAIVLRMLPANETPGRKEYFADLTYTDPAPQTVRVTFRLELPEQQLSVKPRALVVYQTRHEPTTHAVSVADSRSEPSRVINAVVNSPFATVEVLGSEDDPEFGRVTHLQVVVSPQLPVGRHEAVISIDTSDEASPVLKVPMLMYGPAAGE